MNEESSRSHAVCTITLSCYTSTSPTDSLMYTSKIQLVDLAGSERLSQTFSRTTKETCQINKGLHALSNVIMALSPLSAAAPTQQHVPYRDSKLTRVLQDALGGSARTVLIACVSSADESVNETLSTLHYATRARRIQSRPAPASADARPETLSALQRMQWVLLRRYLASVGLMPIPEVLMKDVHAMPEPAARLHLLEAANALEEATRRDVAEAPPIEAPQLTPLPSAAIPHDGGNCLDRMVNATLPPSPSPLTGAGTVCSSCQQPAPGQRPAVCTAETQTAPGGVPVGAPAGSGSGFGADSDAMLGNMESLLCLDASPAMLCGASASGQSGDVAAKYLPRGSDEGCGESGSQAGSRDRGTVGDDLKVEGCGALPRQMSGRAHALGQGLFAGPLLWSAPGVSAGSGGRDEGVDALAGVGCMEDSGDDSRTDALDISRMTEEGDHDMVVFDEDAASYISATDYRQMLHSIAPELGEEAEALHTCHRRLQDEQSGTETAHSGAVAVLRAQIDDLEAVMEAQEGELQVLRAEEGRARDACAELQHTCTALHSQIQEKHAQLEQAHGGLRALEQSLDRSEAESAAACAQAEARVADIAGRKAELERQLRSTGAAAAAARAQGAATRVHALEARLQGTRAAKASAEQQLQDCRVAHQAEKRNLQRELAGLQRQLRGTEKRALALLRSRSQQEEALARKDRQIQTSQHALQELQAAVGASPRRQDIAQQTLQWWDRQIALLAQRASASGRVADLEAQHAALQQQLAALQKTATAGYEEGEAAWQEERERLALQLHVAAGSLAVGREQLASAAMIKTTLQAAVRRLGLPAARHLLLHLVSALLTTLTREQDSRLQLSALRSSLSLVTQLNRHLQGNDPSEGPCPAPAASAASTSAPAPGRDSMRSTLSVEQSPSTPGLQQRQLTDVEGGGGAAGEQARAASEAAAGGQRGQGGSEERSAAADGRLRSPTPQRAQSGPDSSAASCSPQVPARLLGPAAMLQIGLGGGGDGGAGAGGSPPGTRTVQSAGSAAASPHSRRGVEASPGTKGNNAHRPSGGRSPGRAARAAPLTRVAGMHRSTEGKTAASAAPPSMRGTQPRPCKREVGRSGERAAGAAGMTPPRSSASMLIEQATMAAATAGACPPDHGLQQKDVRGVFWGDRSEPRGVAEELRYSRGLQVRAGEGHGRVQSSREAMAAFGGLRSPASSHSNGHPSQPRSAGGAHGFARGDQAEAPWSISAGGVPDHIRVPGEAERRGAVHGIVRGSTESVKWSGGLAQQEAAWGQRGGGPCSAGALHPGAARGRATAGQQGRTRLSFASPGGHSSDSGTGAQHVRSAATMQMARPRPLGGGGAAAITERSPQRPGAAALHSWGPRTAAESPRQPGACQPRPSGAADTQGAARWRLSCDRLPLHGGTAQAMCDSASSVPASPDLRPRSGRKKVQFAEDEEVLVASHPVTDPAWHDSWPQ